MSIPVTVQGVKRRLAGLEGWLAAAASQASYGDDAIAEIIPGRIRQMERDLQFRILPVRLYIPASDDGAYPATEDIPRARAAAYPYYPEDVAAWFKITLRERPVRQVDRFRLFLGTQLIYTFPTEWFSLDTQSGELHLLPVSGSLQSVSSSAFAYIARLGFGRGIIPNAIHIDYVAGLEDDWQDMFEWADLLKALERDCALGVLEDIAHLLDAGKMSKTIQADGVSQTTQWSRFTDRKQELEASRAAFVELFRAQNSPISMGLL